MIPAFALPSLLRTRDADDVYARLEPLVRELRETVGTIPGVAITARWMPARTDTAWWWAAMDAAAQPVYLRGRIRFIGPDGVASEQGAGFPSALLVFR